ncbi:excalibur calcium-binding domain-containing protein [Streptomyces sp. HNM0575]|uniref:excalibur calcium-binding domain-containing protein n=1 Tax=Streptomyces sp. HNM0575 TaxID=2716338 RepID=UPI0019CF9C26|nr:excalibur calcium-binding domain-containing protein [Streptomyces sp. HNM0575]
MKIRTSAATIAAIGALGLALAPSVAVAHDGGHPFKNCSAAYDAGYSNIRESDEHYGKHLDRDGDGVACDQPPADFVPAKDRGGEGSDEAGDKDGGKSEGKKSGEDAGGLAETGGDDSTPYIAAAGGLVLVAGAGVLVATQRRRESE